MEVSGSAVQNVADVSVLQKHLRKLVPLLLEDGGEAPAVLEAALEEKGSVEHMRKFLSDPQVHTVLVERSTLKGEASAGRVPRCQDGGGVRRCPLRAAALPPGGRGSLPRSPARRGAPAARSRLGGRRPATLWGGELGTGALPRRRPAGLGAMHGRWPGPQEPASAGGSRAGCHRLVLPAP